MFLEGLTQDFSEIQKHVEDRLAETPELEVAGEAAYPPDKWLLSSAVQKLIRRGRPEEAVRVALALHAFDRTYLPRRLPVIALEDIGIADLILCFDVLLAFGPARRVKQALDERQLIANLVFRLAVAVKSRTACDLLCLAHAHPEFPSYAMQLAAQRAETLIALALDASAQDSNRALALHLLSGLVLRRGQWARTVSKFNPEALHAVALKLELPPIVLWLLLRGRNTAGLAAMLPLVTEIVRKEEEGRIAVKAGPITRAEAPIRGLPAYALDIHTAVGKAAIGQFATLLRRRHARIFGGIPQNRFTPIVGMALFHMEGSWLERFVSSAELDLYRERIEIVELQGRGLPGIALREELYRVIDAEHWKLWEMRWSALDALYPPVRTA